MRFVFGFIIFFGLKASLGLAQNSDILLNIPVGNPQSSASITWDEKFIVGSRDDKLLLFNFETGTFLNHFWTEPNNQSITDVLVISDDYVLAATNEKLWEVSIGDGKRVSEYRQVSTPIKKLKISANGLFFGALSSDGNSLTVFEIATQDAILVLSNKKLRGQKISDFDFTKDGKRLITATQNNVLVWKVKNGKVKKTLGIVGAEHIQSIPTTKLFLSSDGSREVRVHSTKKTDLVSVELSKQPIFVSTDLTDNAFIAADESSFYAFDVNGNLLQKIYHNYGSSLTKMDLTLNGWMLLKNESGAFVFFDMFEMRSDPSKQLSWRKPELDEMFFSGHGTSIALKSEEGEHILPIKSQPQKNDATTESKYDFRVEQSTLRIIKKENNNEVRRFDVGAAEIVTWERNSDLSNLFIADSRNRLYFYDVELRRLLGEAQTLPNTIKGLEYLPSYKMVAALHERDISFVTKNGLDSSVSIDFPIGFVQFSEKGNIGVVSEKSKAPLRISVLEYSSITSSHLPLHALTMAHPYDKVTVSPDGSFVIISEKRGPIHIYDVARKTMVAQIFVMNQNSDYIIFTPDGRYDQTRENFVNYLYEVNGTKEVPLAKSTRLRYQPGLLEQIFSRMDSVLPRTESELEFESIDFRPVYFVDPKPDSVLVSDRVKITLELNPRFEDVKEVNIFHNEILVSQVGIDRFATDKNERTFYTFDMKLASGMNVLSLRTKLLAQREQQQDMLHLIQGRVSRPSGTLHVLGISIDEYSNNGNKVSDASQEMEEVLQTLQKGHSKAFKTINLMMLQNESATNAKILEAIKNTASAMNKEDVLVLYLVGAGGIDLDEGLYFMAADEKEKTSVEEITRLLPSKDFLLIMDISEYKFRELSKLSESIFLDKQFHLLINDRKTNPEFSSFLLEGLTGNADTAIRDGFVTARELRRYLSRKQTEEGALFLSRGADFVLSGRE